VWRTYDLGLLVPGFQFDLLVLPGCNFSSRSVSYQLFVGNWLYFAHSCRRLITRLAFRGSLFFISNNDWLFRRGCLFVFENGVIVILIFFGKLLNLFGTQMLVELLHSRTHSLVIADRAIV
jgi:hypothetical protein